MPDFWPHFVSRVDRENPWMDLFHIAHTHPSGGVDLPLGFTPGPEVVLSTASRSLSATTPT